MSVSAMLAAEFMLMAHGCDEKDVLDSRVGLKCPGFDDDIQPGALQSS